MTHSICRGERVARAISQPLPDVHGAQRVLHENATCISWLAFWCQVGQGGKGTIITITITIAIIIIIVNSVAILAQVILSAVADGMKELKWLVP